jgi:hypothetical protein
MAAFFISAIESAATRTEHQHDASIRIALELASHCDTLS